MVLDDKLLKESDMLGLASFGFFIILVGVIFAITPNLVDKIGEFFRSFELVEVYPNVNFPAPTSSHPVLYTAVAQFCVAYGLFHLPVLFLRVYLGDYLSRRAGTLSGIVFWLGAGYFLIILSAGNIGWFAFLSGLIIFVGLSLVVRSLVILLFGVVRRTL